MENQKLKRHTPSLAASSSFNRRWCRIYDSSFFTLNLEFNDCVNTAWTTKGERMGEGTYGMIGMERK